jgi:hypothetical protein
VIQLVAEEVQVAQFELQAVQTFEEDRYYPVGHTVPVIQVDEVRSQVYVEVQSLGTNVAMKAVD